MTDDKGFWLLERLGLDKSKKCNMIIMVDRRKLSDDEQYQFRILGISAKIDNLIQQFDYEECIKRDIGHLNFNIGASFKFINAIKLPCILDISIDGKNFNIILRGLNKNDLEYYERMKEQYDIGDPELDDDGLLHFHVI